MIRVGYSILALLVFPLFTEAQDRSLNDRVVLSDGEKLRGEILEYSSGEKVVLRTSGDTLHFEGEALNEVSSIDFDHFSYKNERGLWYELNFGVTTGKTFESAASESFPFINLVSGYRFSQFAAVGIATGYQLLDNINIVPVYASFRGEIFDKRVTPFYYSDIGYGIGIKKDQDTFFGGQEKVKGGLLYGIGTGLKIRMAKTYLATSFGYRLQKSRNERRFVSPTFDSFLPGEEEVVVENRTYKRLEFRIGIGF